MDLPSPAKSLLRRVVPHSRRPLLRARYNQATWRLYSGASVSCNCCCRSFRRFRTSVTDGGHRSLMCPRCGSLSRHRTNWMYLTERTDALAVRPLRLLHVAPEPCLSRPLCALDGIDYLSADFDSTFAMERIDLREIGHPDASFDAVICNHVLNFIDDDRKAMRELARVLRPGGWALLQSVVDERLQNTLDSAPSGADEREGRYEEEFFRRYGRDYAERLHEAGFEVTPSNFVRELPDAAVEQIGLDLDETIYFCRRA